MPYPYKKMTQEDFDKIIEITDNERVWVGDEIAKEYYKDVNHIFIWHGRNLCTSQNPKCDKCPLKNYCKFH